MNLIKAIIQRFCKHEFEEKRLHGPIIDGEWISVPVTVIKVCKKCGKVLW